MSLESYDQLLEWLCQTVSLQIEVEQILCQICMFDLVMQMGRDTYLIHSLLLMFLRTRNRTETPENFEDRYRQTLPSIWAITGFSKFLRMRSAASQATEVAAPCAGVDAVKAEAATVSAIELIFAY